jgi:hypothetical protein
MICVRGEDVKDLLLFHVEVFVFLRDKGAGGVDDKLRDNDLC